MKHTFFHIPSSSSFVQTLSWLWVLPSPLPAFKATVEKLNKADMYKDKKWERGRSSRAPNNSKDERMDMRNIMKDIELMGHSHMTWKEKKALENKKVVSLGGKLPKQQRLPLSVAKGRMKKQKEREQKMLQELEPTVSKGWRPTSLEEMMKLAAEMHQSAAAML